MTVDSPIARVDSLLAHFDTLNPEIAEIHLQALRDAAQADPAAAYARVLAKVESLIPRFLESPVKREERAIMREFYHFVNQASQKLLESGELPDEPDAPVITTSTALVPERHFSTTRWCLATSQDLIPREVLTAADAAQRRNYLINSVMEPLFVLMLELAPEQAMEWQLAFASQEEPPPDPDLIRDLLRAWRQLDRLDPRAIRQAMRWSTDEAAWRHWPAIPQEADKLLRRHALVAWTADPPRIGAARHLARLAPFRSEERLLRWLHASISQMGASVDFFCAQAERLARPDGQLDDEPDDWRRAALFREIIWLHQMMKPLLVLSDLYLAAPAGPTNFALAIFGFTAEARRTWQEELARRSTEIVRRMFISDMKQGRRPGDTIHKLCFGDEHLEEEIKAELDLFTEDFDSMNQRELVVDRLAAVYASYKEHSLMAGEMGRRYRRLVRMLHEDNLRRLLTPEDFAQTQNAMSDVLLDLSTIAASCRKFLNTMRQDDLTAAQLVAVEMDFVLEIRARRMSVIQQILPA